ncbi:MAG: hypothetical protein M3P31_06880, partial [Actinomycetota bacterium]|nr:hypothetical protein [Actinomycetota bacterium]
RFSLVRFVGVAMWTVNGRRAGRALDRGSTEAACEREAARPVLVSPGLADISPSVSVLGVAVAQDRPNTFLG